MGVSAMVATWIPSRRERIGVSVSLKCLCLLAAPAALLAQSQAPATAPPARAFGVLPNYRLAELSDPFQPISVKRKFYIGYKDATDYPVFALGGVQIGRAHV